MAQPTPSQRKPRSRPSSSKPRRTASAQARPEKDVSVERRRALIAEAAYLRAEQRGFQGGDPVADWLESEQEVDALLSRSTG